MKEKKLEWAKPVLEYLGGALTNGEIAGTCDTGTTYNLAENCGGGQGAVTKCGAGTGGPL
jgi:hypothetical protein